MLDNNSVREYESYNHHEGVVSGIIKISHTICILCCHDRGVPHNIKEKRFLGGDQTVPKRFCSEEGDPDVSDTKV